MKVERDQLYSLAEADTRSGHQVIRSSIPWRALAVGTLVLPLFLLVCWSLAWRGVSPRLACFLCLSRQEMILVYLMTTVGTALAGECWAIHVVPGLAGTAVY